MTESTLRVFESALPLPELGVLAGFTAWKEGRPVTQPQPFRYRETIAVSLPPLPDNLSRHLFIAVDTPAGPLTFDPVLLSTTQALFIVGPDWPSGEYRLQMTLSDQQLNTHSAKSNIIATITDRRQRDFSEPVAAHSIYANFAQQVALLGYDLGTNRAEAGGGLPLTLFWRGLDWMGEDYTIFTKLIKANDQAVHGGRDRLPREGYRTLYWAPGELITDPFGVPVAADAPDGIYFINVGLYREVNGQAVSLPLVQDGQPTDVTSINLGPVKIGDTPANLTIEAANPKNPVNIPFGEQIELLGFDLTNQQISKWANGQIDEPTSQVPDNSPNSINSTNSINSINLKLYWQALRQPAADYTTFVHLRDAAGNTVAQKDQPPLNGAYPSSLWEPGEVIADEITVPLPSDLPPGDYTVVVGLYDFNTFQRLAVPDNPANEVTLTAVQIGK